MRTCYLIPGFKADYSPRYYFIFGTRIFYKGNKKFKPFFVDFVRG